MQTKEEFVEVIKNPGICVSALLHLYSFQTEDEQSIQDSVYQNGVGFNGADAGILTSMVEFYQQRGYLTDNQLNCICRLLPKYFLQLKDTPLTPVEIKGMTPIMPEPIITGETPVPAPTKTAEIIGENYIIRFPYSPAMITEIKTLSGRKWNSYDKHWTAPVCFDTQKRLEELGFSFIGAALTPLTPKEIIPVVLIKEVVGLKLPLFPYQLDGVNFIESHNGRALVADEMGLGKTCQALTYLQHHPELRPAIITVPASLKLNWAKEIKLWMTINCDFHIISGKHSQRERLPKASIYIINYDILAVSNPDAKKKSDKYICRPDILGIEPKIVIADEAHVWKSPDAQRTKAIMDLAKKVPHFIALTGTPIINRPIEIFNCIKAIEPKLFPSYFHYAMKYCNAKHNGYGWNFNGASSTQELHEKLTNSIMIRRKKSEVLKDLPPKIRTVVPMELDNQREYNIAEADLIGWLRTNFGNGKAEKAQQAEALTRIGELKRLAVRGKLKECMDWIEDFLESGGKLVVFAVHKFVIDVLMEKFAGRAVKIDGSVTNRQAPVDAFQTDENIRLFVGNIQAAGVGITLTAASNTCFLELDFSPGKLFQAEDRVHRIGQKSDSVTAWYLLADGTIETELMEMIERKNNVISAVLDGIPMTNDCSVFGEFVNMLSSK